MKNSVMLSVLFGLSILLSTPKAESLTNKQKLAIGAAVALVLLALVAAKKNSDKRDCPGGVCPR